MYLTKLTLDPKSAQARRDLGNAYEMHRTLVRAFVPDANSMPPRFLWRLEASRSAWNHPVVLVQSETEADWSVLMQLPNYLEVPVENKRLVLDHLVQPERPYRFRLLANPTVTREGKRHGLVGDRDLTLWMERQGERHGFVVQSCVVNGKDTLTTRNSGKASLCIQRVRFEGVLQVHQPDVFKQTLIAGIGPAKAFGCGMLSVAHC